MEKYRKNVKKVIFCCIVFAALMSGTVVAKAAVKLSKTNIVLLLGQEGKDMYSLAVSGVEEGEKLTFSSKNTAVATVDKKGKITAVSPGKTVVICTVTDASGKKIQKKAVVRVYDNIKSITLAVKDTQPNALYKNKSYALTYTCKTMAGSNKNTGNYIYYEVLTSKGKVTTSAQVDSDGNFTAKKCAVYTVYAYVFQDSETYQIWEKDREKNTDYILAQDAITLTVTTKNYKKSEYKIGSYSVSLPEKYEVEIREETKNLTAISVQVKNSDGQNAISNIQMILDRVDKAQDYELLAAAMISIYTKEALEENWKSAYNAKKATVKNLSTQKISKGEQEILKICYELTLKNIVIQTENASEIKISRMDFVNTVYTWYDGKTHISITVTDALESLQPNISEVAKQMCGM